MLSPILKFEHFFTNWQFKSTICTFCTVPFQACTLEISACQRSPTFFKNIPTEDLSRSFDRQKRKFCGGRLGTSSFGMSGVNAHAIFSGSTAANRSMPGLRLGKLFATRHWPSPKALHMVGQASISKNVCSFALDLASPDFSFLGHHKVWGSSYSDVPQLILRSTLQTSCVYTPLWGFVEQHAIGSLNSILAALAFTILATWTGVFLDTPKSGCCEWEASNIIILKKIDCQYSSFLPTVKPA